MSTAMPVTYPHHPGRSGLTLVYVAVALAVLVAFVALGVDMGRMFLGKSELEAAADASARASVWAVPTLDFTDAQDRAISVAAANTADGTSVALDRALDIEFGIWRRGTRTFEVLTGDARAAANAVRTTSRRLNSRGNAMQLDFAPAIGRNRAEIQASAIAMIRGGWRYRGSGMGIVGIDAMTLNGTTTTDSYNATVGAYTPATANDGGSIASNGDITLVGTVHINGDVRPGSGTDDSLSVNSNSTVDGWRAPLDEELVYPPATTPAAGEYNNAPLTTAGYLDRENDFVLTGKATATIPAGVFLVRDLDLRANQQIQTTGAVKIYVTGSVDMTGSVSVNTGLPANLEIIVIGSGSVRLGGGSQLYAQIYAPLSEVTVHGTSSEFGLFGAVIGKTLNVLGNSAIHYDESLGYRPVGIPDEFYVELVR